MKKHEGIIEDIGILQPTNGRGGKITFIKINRQIFRNVGCPIDVFSFMKIGMSATLYMHTVPVLGKVILGVKDMKDNTRLMAGSVEIIASCIQMVVILAILLAIPAWLIGSQFNAVSAVMIILCVIAPVIASIMLLLGYINAKAE